LIGLAALTIVIAISIIRCGGDGGSSAPVFTIGGAVYGLAGDGLILQNNGGDDLAVAGVSFEFATTLRDGSGYEVTVFTQPTGQYCDVSNGIGTISGADVTDVTVTCRGWGTAELIEADNTGNAISAHIGIDAAGNALAMWAQSDGTRYNIWSNRYTVGSGWGTAELIETNNAGNAHSPDIAVNADGIALAVWYQWDGMRYSIWSNRYTPGSGWGTPELIETDSSGDALTPQIAIDAAGNALSVWRQSDGTRDNVWSNRYSAGSGWGTPELIETDNAGHAQFPAIAFDAAGNALSVWRQSDGTRYNIWSNRYTTARGWGPPELIETDDAGDALIPQIAFDTGGNAQAVWAQYGGTTFDIWSNRYNAGSGWGTAESIETDAGGAIDPQIAIDTAGNAMAVWQQHDGYRANIWSNRYTAGSGWGTAELVPANNAGSAVAPQIAFDPAGNALVVWIYYHIWSNRYTVGSGWGTAELIAIDSPGNASSPKIAIDAAGNGLAVWNQSDGTRYSIWSNRYE